ncbi:hypothetical protein HFO61_03865 [Rhizobium leguminosarum]|uniref:hypothetical protein n=1 Tax=Rhizobium leguminosarum TaxID=384 RepID=UPI001C98B4C6|nr:hypothetical protein [Rhizobium leguminosarum]MBY5545986.1 hypothetical protein [Rhizobium leguminosarum]
MARTTWEQNIGYQAVAWYDGDLRATVETLLEDCRFLREQLDIAGRCMSSGLTRG